MRVLMNLLGVVVFTLGLVLLSHDENAGWVCVVAGTLITIEPMGGSD